MFPPCCNAEIRFDKPAEAGSRQPIPEELADASVRILSEVSVSRGQRASVERHNSPISPRPAHTSSGMPVDSAPTYRQMSIYGILPHASE